MRSSSRGQHSSIRQIALGLFLLLALGTGSAIGGFLFPVEADVALSCTSRRIDTESDDYAEVNLSRHSATVWVHRSNPAVDFRCDLESTIDSAGMEQSSSTCAEISTVGTQAVTSELAKPTPDELLISLMTSAQAVQVIQLAWIAQTRQVRVSLPDETEDGPYPVQVLPCQNQ